MNCRVLAIKSLREKTEDFNCWQGGHHFAPQYRNTGLCWLWACWNALATPPAYQSIPGASRGFDASPGAARQVDAMSKEALAQVINSR